MKEYNKALRFMMTLVLSCLVAVFIGFWIDKKLHTTPLFLLLFMFYAIGANLYLLMKGMDDNDG